VPNKSPKTVRIYADAAKRMIDRLAGHLTPEEMLS